MAANLDKAESALTTVSDVAFVRAVDASGNSVKISKSDLASVLGVPFIKNVTITDMNSSDCMDNIISAFKTSEVSNLPDGMTTGSSVYCLCVCFKNSVFTSQSLYVSNSEMYIRFVWGGDHSRPWKKVTFA
jgi:hypothetical protein